MCSLACTQLFPKWYVLHIFSLRCPTKHFTNNYFLRQFQTTAIILRIYGHEHLPIEFCNVHLQIVLRFSRTKHKFKKRECLRLAALNDVKKYFIVRTMRWSTCEHFLLLYVDNGLVFQDVALVVLGSYASYENSWCMFDVFIGCVYRMCLSDMLILRLSFLLRFDLRYRIIMRLSTNLPPTERLFHAQYGLSLTALLLVKSE